MSDKCKICGVREAVIKGRCDECDRDQSELAPAAGSARDWSKDFNALPDEVRLIGCAMEARTRIQMLEMEKDRLKKSHRRDIGEIDAHIENCRVWLHKLEVPNTEVSEVAVADSTKTRGVHPPLSLD